MSDLTIPFVAYLLVILIGLAAGIVVGLTHN